MSAYQYLIEHTPGTSIRIRGTATLATKQRARLPAGRGRIEEGGI